MTGKEQDLYRQAYAAGYRAGKRELLDALRALLEVPSNDEMDRLFRANV